MRKSRNFINTVWHINITHSWIRIYTHIEHQTYIEIRVVGVSDDGRRVKVEIVQGEVVPAALWLLLLLQVVVVRRPSEGVVARDLLHGGQLVLLLLHGRARCHGGGGGRRGGGRPRGQRAARAAAAVARRRRHHARAGRVRRGRQDRRARTHPDLLG